MEIERKIHSQILKTLKRGKSILLFGPRQVGKTTLLKSIKCDLFIQLAQRSVRLRYERDPSLIEGELQALYKIKKSKIIVVIDEIQKVPEFMDPIQDFIDQGIAQFILTGSSARKLRRQTEINLLPGRVVTYRLDPFSLSELDQPKLKNLLLYGSLPGIYLDETTQNMDEDLRSYVDTYLDEEIRVEAQVRRLEPFARFLELAGIEAGRLLNLNEISKDLGISRSTLTNYLEILIDTLIIERIEPITVSTNRKKLIKSSRFLFFDLGVRRFCANEGIGPTPDRYGQLFEQFVGMELLREMRLTLPAGRLRFWSDPDGPEVDWVIDINGTYIPIEVKWTSTPNNRDAKHLITFMEEYKSTQGFIICQTPNPILINDQITAINWQSLRNLEFLTDS